MSRLIKGFSYLLVLGFGFALIGCGQKDVVVKEGPAERAGKSVDRAVAKTGEKMVEAKDAIVDKTEEAGEYMSDGYITSKIKAKILVDPLLKVFQINVITTDGVVQLSGEVDTLQSVGRAVEIANSVKGVKSVKNELTLKKNDKKERVEIAKEETENKDGKSSEIISDSYITTKIKAEILADPLLKSLQISVVTKNGVVTLSGVVDAEINIRRSEEIAKSIKGVESVKMELTIKETK